MPRTKPIITPRQHEVLLRDNDIEGVRENGKGIWRLDGKPVTDEVLSLGAKGLMLTTRDGKRAFTTNAGLGLLYAIKTGSAPQAHIYEALLPEYGRKAHAILETRIADLIAGGATEAEVIQHLNKTEAVLRQRSCGADVHLLALTLWRFSRQME